MGIRTAKCRLREGFRHQQRRRAVSTAHVGNDGACGELVHHTVERGQPAGDEIGSVRRLEEPFASDVHIGVVLTPPEAVPGCGCLEHSRGVADRPVRQLEQATDECRAAVVGQGHRVLQWQVEASGVRVIVDERTRGLGIEPLACVVHAGARALGKLLWGTRAVPMKGSVVAQTFAHHDEGAVEGRTDFADGPDDERHQLVGIHFACGRGSFGFCGHGLSFWRGHIRLCYVFRSTGQGIPARYKK